MMCLLKNTWNLKKLSSHQKCHLPATEMPFMYQTITSCVSLENLFYLPLHLFFLPRLFGLYTSDRKDCLLLCFCTVPSETATSACHRVELCIHLLHVKAQPTTLNFSRTETCSLVTAPQALIKTNSSATEPTLTGFVHHGFLHRFG